MLTSDECRVQGVDGDGIMLPSDEYRVQGLGTVVRKNLKGRMQKGLGWLILFILAVVAFTALLIEPWRFLGRKKLLPPNEFYNATTLPSQYDKGVECVGEISCRAQGRNFQCLCDDYVWDNVAVGLRPRSEREENGGR